MIYVDDEALAKLQNALLEAGESYKKNYEKLNNLVTEIAQGDIQGDPARDFLSKFEEKRELFDGVQKTINDAEEYAGLKNRQFSGMIEDLSEGMR